MTVFTCKEDFISMMTAIYDAWASKKGHANVRLMLEPVEQQELFCDYIHVEGNEEKAEKVVRSIQKKISFEAYRWIYYAAHSYKEERLDVIYRFLIIGFVYGRKVTQMLTEEPVMQLLDLSRKVGNEAHLFREFIRFSPVDNQIYISHIEPKCDVVMINAEHFQDRMPSEYWIIVDDIRKKAAVHPKDEDFYMKELTKEEFEGLSELEKRRDTYTDLWETFFETIAVKERENKKCQQNRMPLWMRKHAVEFMDRKEYE